MSLPSINTCPKCGAVTLSDGVLKDWCQACDQHARYITACNDIVEKYRQIASYAISRSEVTRDEWISKVSAAYAEDFDIVKARLKSPPPFEIPSLTAVWKQAGGPDNNNQLEIRRGLHSKLSLLAAKAKGNGISYDAWVSDLKVRLGYSFVAVSSDLKRAWGIIEPPAAIGSPRETSYVEKMTPVNKDLPSLKERLSEKDFGRFIQFSIVIRAIAAILLIYALADHGDDFYTLLRFVVFSVGLFCAHLSYKQHLSYWFWGFGLLAAFFNPFIPIHLERDTWAIIDGVAALLLVGSACFVRDRRNPTTTEVIKKD